MINKIEKSYNKILNFLKTIKETQKNIEKNLKI